MGLGGWVGVVEGGGERMEGGGGGGSSCAGINVCMPN